MISVVICTYNRSASLRAALESLAKTSVPPDLMWEVIVVDNNSSDHTRSVVERFIESARLRVKYVFERRQGLCHARNTGVGEAKGEIISFIDDDVVVSEKWLVEIQRAFNEYKAACVGGRVLISQDTSKPYWWDTRYNGALGECDLGDSIIIADENYSGTIGIGANISFKRSMFSKYGFFRTDLDRVGKKLSMGGDTEFYNRLKNAREIALYFPNAVVYQCPHRGRVTGAYLNRWHFRFGEWGVYLDEEISEKRQARIFGVPRTLYRSALVNFVKGLALLVTGKPAKAFYYELQLVSFTGYLWGLAKKKFCRQDFLS